MIFHQQDNYSSEFPRCSQNDPNVEETHKLRWKREHQRAPERFNKIVISCICSARTWVILEAALSKSKSELFLFLQIFGVAILTFFHSIVFSHPGTIRAIFLPPNLLHSWVFYNHPICLEFIFFKIVLISRHLNSLSTDFKIPIQSIILLKLRLILAAWRIQIAL